MLIMMLGLVLCAVGGKWTAAWTIVGIVLVCVGIVSLILFFVFAYDDVEDIETGGVLGVLASTPLLEENKDLVSSDDDNHYLIREDVSVVNTGYIQYPIREDD